MLRMRTCHPHLLSDTSGLPSNRHLGYGDGNAVGALLGVRTTQLTALRLKRRDSAPRGRTLLGAVANYALSGDGRVGEHVRHVQAARRGAGRGLTLSVAGLIVDHLDAGRSG